MFWVRIRLRGREYLGVLDTGATISIVAKKILPCGSPKNTMTTAAIRMGDGHVVHSCGDCEVEVPMGSRTITHRFYVMDTEAFDFLLGTDFFVQHSQIQSLTLQAPYLLYVDQGEGRESVPLEQSEHTSSYLRVSNEEPSNIMAASKTEDYQLLGEVLDQGLKELGYSREDLSVELFASDKQHVLDLYCSKRKNCSYKFYWPSFGMAYRNPRFSELGKILTKVALERSRMVLCSPDWGAHGANQYWRTLLDRLTISSVWVPDEAIYVPLGRKTPIGKPGWGSMLSVVDGGLTSIPWEDLDSTLVQAIQQESDGLGFGDLKDRIRPQDAIETIPGGDEYVVTNTNAPNSPCHVSVPDGVSECGLSELPSSIHPDDETEHDAFFVQTLVEEVENAEYVAPLKPLLCMRVEDPVDEELDPRSRLREYVDSKRRLVAKKLCYAKPTRSSWPLKQGRKGDLSQVKEDLEQKITTWQREVDLKLMKSVWGAQVRTPEEDNLSEECVCEPPRACLCCHRPPEMAERDLLYAYQGLKDITKGEELVEDHLPTSITQGASNLHSDEDMEDKIKLLDQRVQTLIRTYLEVFAELPPPASCDKLVQMDLKVKPEFVGHKIRRRPYPAPKEQAEEIQRQIQECIDAGLVLEYKDGDYPQHCSPCFLVAKTGSTAKRLVVHYGELKKKTLNHSGSIPNMEATLEKIASCRYKTKMDKRSGFWQVDLTPNAQELLAFITLQWRVFKWKVMRFGVAKSPALFQELMNKMLSILRRRPKVQGLTSRGAQMEAHINDVCLGTNTQEDHLILLGDFSAVCQENHTRLRLEKCEFMQETMQFLGFDVGYGWWTPAASKAKPLMDAKVRHEDPKEGLHDVRSSIGACNLYCRHIKSFTYTSAILTDLIKKSTTWRWGPQEQQAFDELKDKVANAKCLGVPRAQGGIILVTDASNVGGGGTLFQWQALEKEEFDSAISQWGTEGLNRDETLKHSYPDDKWVLVPLDHWNRKWNQARGNYSTYEQELLAGMLVLSSQARLLGSNPVVWLCDHEPVRTFQKGPPPEKARLRRWWTYLSQLRLTVHHIQGVKNECADYISRNNFDALIGARSEALAKEAFSRMDVNLDLNMTMMRPLDGLHQSEYLKEFGNIYKRLEKRLEPLLVNQDQWKREKRYLWHEDRIVVPSDRVPALLKWTHESSGHVGAHRTLRLFKQWFDTTWTDDQLRKTLQPIMDKCPCRSCKPGDIRYRGLYSTLPIPHCANSVLYVDYTEMPKFGGYDFAVVVTCWLTTFTRLFPCTKHITGEETIKILLEEWFCVYGAPEEINSDEDVRVRSDTGWYRRVLRSLNVQVSTGIPYSHTSNPLCERQIRVLKRNVMIWCKTERTRDWVRLLPVISLMMNSQESSATGYSPPELFLGGPAWFLHAPYPEDTHFSVGEWVQEQQAKVDKAKAMLHRVRERQWNKENKHRVPATYQEGDWVLVHHSRLPAWPRSTSDDQYFGPSKILSVDGRRITVQCAPRLGGTLVCAAQHLKRYSNPEDLCGEEWELNDEKIAAYFTYTSAILTEVIKKSTTWRWGPQEQQAFDELKDKVANAKCLGLHRAPGGIILVTDASNVRGGRTLFQWQALEKEEFDSAISQWGTEGLNRDGTLKHSYPDDKWVLVPLGHWNWKWNQARGNYSTYEQDLLTGMLVPFSQARLLVSNPVAWVSEQEPVRTFQKGPPPEKAKLRRWWTYLSQLRLTVHHIQGVKNDCADYISRNNFDALIGARSEALAKEAFSRKDVHLDLDMTMIRPLDRLHQSEYLKEFGNIYKRLEKRLEPLLVNQDQWKREKRYLWHEDRIVVPSDRVPALLKWTHESSGHVGAHRTLRLFKQWFHTTWTDDQLWQTLQPIMDKCPCRSCKPGDIRHRGLYSTLPFPHCANSVLYVDYTEMPKFGGYDFDVVVTCWLTRFTRVFPCTKHITGEETIKILLEEWFWVHGAPEENNSDEDVRVRSDNGWYKRVLRSLNVQVSTGIPYSHTTNPLCERQIRVLKKNVRIWCKTERTRDWVRLLPVISLMMNSKESSATGYSPHELFLGRPAWFLHAPYQEDTHSSVDEGVQEQQAKVDKAKAMLHRVRECQWNKKNKHRVPATYQEGDWVLVHHSRPPAWPRSTSDDPYFGPYKILSVDGRRVLPV